MGELDDIRSAITLRAGAPEDVNLVLSSWVKSHIGNALGDGVPGDPADVFFHRAHVWLTRKLLQRCALTVACNLDDPDQIYGYVVHERLGGPKGPLLVAYVYVKYPFRKLGIARLLWEEVNPDAEPVVTLFKFPGFRALEKRLKLAVDHELLFRLADGELRGEP